MGWQFWTIRRIVVQKQGWRAQPGLADDSRGMAPTGRGGNRVAYRLLHRLHARRRRRRLSRRTLRRVRVGHLCEPDRVPGAVFWVPVGGLVARGVGEQATLRRVSCAIARRKRRATQASGPRDTQAQRELRGAQHTALRRTPAAIATRGSSRRKTERRVAVVTEQTTHAPVTSNAMAWRPQGVDLPGARDDPRSGNWMTPGSPAEYGGFMNEV